MSKSTKVNYTIEAKSQFIYGFKITEDNLRRLIDLAKTTPAGDVKVSIAVTRRDGASYNVDTVDEVCQEPNAGNESLETMTVSILGDFGFSYLLFQGGTVYAKTVGIDKLQVTGFHKTLCAFLESNVCTSFWRSTELYTKTVGLALVIAGLISLRPIVDEYYENKRLSLLAIESNDIAIKLDFLIGQFSREREVQNDC